jgi:hypothetical protein
MSGDRMKASSAAITSGSRISRPTIRRRITRLATISPFVNALRLPESMSPDLVRNRVT